MRVWTGMLAFIMMLGCFSIASGAPINAASCAQSDIQAAIDSAHSGDTVFIPACSPTTISTQINIGTTSAPFAKNLTISGSGAGKTILVDGTYAPSSLFSAVVPSGNYIRFTGMTLVSKKGPNSDGTIHIQGGTTSFRMDHILFDMTGCAGGRMVLIGSYVDPGPTYATYGVIDNNTFSVESGTIGCDGVSIFANGDEQWKIPLSLGTANAVYMENNNFDFPDVGDGAYDAYDGSRIVFRYNNVWNTDIGNHGHDSSARSAVSYEVYDNNFNPPAPDNYNGTSLSSFFNSRGGTGVMFNNTITQGYNTFVALQNYRSCPASGNGGAEGYATNTNNSSTTLQDSTASFGSYRAGALVFNGSYTLYDLTDQSSCVLQSGDSNTATTITCAAGLSGGKRNYWQNGDYYAVGRTYYDNFCMGFPPLASSADGNDPGQEGYPCIDQIGRSPSVSGQQTLSPVYQWGNNFKGGTNNTSAVDTWGNCPRVTTYHIVANRDYYDQTGANNHFQSGPSASKPFTCSQGDAYWGTDDNVLYQCGNSNNWKVYFAPYKYPNPLTQKLITPMAPMH